MLIATATGIYYTRDLASFRPAEGSEGYRHALVPCGGKLHSHVMEDKPVLASGDGVGWRELGVKPPPPTFGTTYVHLEGCRRRAAMGPPPEDEEG